MIVLSLFLVRLIGSFILFFTILFSVYKKYRILILPTLFAFEIYMIWLNLFANTTILIQYSILDILMYIISMVIIVVFFHQIQTPKPPSKEEYDYGYDLIC
jgi:ABC-type uncharacterized transport system permease subunit